MERNIGYSEHERRFAASLKRLFRRDERGYALTLTLVALPLIMGVAAYVIDASRVANLHTDLQDAADAMALAGARELDGRDDAIPRAKAAIAAMTGNSAWFGNGGDGMAMGSKVAMTYNAANGQGQVTVQFMEGIPATDDEAIGASNCVTPDGGSASCNVELSWPGNVAQQSNKAAYVRVRATPVNVRTIFPLPGLGRDDISVAAEAVATYTAAACDITPVFICNPYEGEGPESFNDRFKSGDLYAREYRLQLNQSTPGPGNFAFLQTADPGGSALREALATNSPGVCQARRDIETKTGGTIGPAEQGLNTRFGIYAGPMSGSDSKYRPAKNVRMGQDYGNSKKNPSCNTYSPETNQYEAMPLPNGASPQAIGGTSSTMSGNSWDVRCYWYISHGNLTNPPANCTSAPAAPSAVMNYRPSLPPTATTSVPNPSRYDVYRYELATNLAGDAAPGGETGTPPTKCYGSYDLNSFPETVENDRRTIFAAVLDCNAERAAGRLNGHSSPHSKAFVRVFLTKPMVTAGSDKYISMEVVDVTGAGGLGTVENFLREEAELVR